ncbi:unnamed protein product [Merluccius merluccius]
MAWFFIINVYICLCLCVMMVSSFATAHYLNKHMKSLAASGGSLFNPRLGSQIRVTVTGIFQGVLSFIYGLFATAHYLNKHMKSLAASGGSLFNPRLGSQIRVTVTGILQGVLYCLYGVWAIVDAVVFNFSPYFLFGPSITQTVINLYFLGTTVNLWVRQTLFRERAVHVWKAVKNRFGTGKTSEDLGPDENKLTTLAAIESTGVNTAVSM